MRTQKVPLRRILGDLREELQVIKRASRDAENHVARAGYTESARTREKELRNVRGDLWKAHTHAEGALELLTELLLSLAPEEVAVELPEVVLVEEEENE